MITAPEQLYLWLALICYGGSAMLALPQALPQGMRRSFRPKLLQQVLLVAALITAAAITQRWLRTEQGPFLTLFDVLLSNIFSLGFIFALAYWRLPAVRPAAIVAIPILILLTIWSLQVSPEPVPLPPTYQHPWLWVHVLAGKVFLGACLVAVSLAGVLLARAAFGKSTKPDTDAMDAWIWRFLAIAFVFQSLMLLAGAVWASDAWGRYWSWDPLETWALITWLCLAALLHLRVTLLVPDGFAWSAVILVFLLAFLTFFGVPFLNRSPHQGII